MKVLMISGDKSVLAQGSPTYERLELMRVQVEQLDVFVWPQVHTLRQIARATRGVHYDVVTAQDPFWRGYVASHLARRAKARLNLQLHTEFGVQTLWRRIWGAHNLRRADTVRVVSQKIKDSLAYLNLKAPITVLPIYTDLSKFKDIPRTHHPRFGKTLLWIGRFENEKDPLRAISTLVDVRRERVDTGLVMLGTGSLEESLCARVRARGLEDWVEFPGWQGPAPYLAQADVVLSTSHYEGYGVSILEALAAGVPVVAPDVGVAKEAGATVVPKISLAEAVLTVLGEGARGVLAKRLLSKEEWVAAWKQSL